MFQLTMFNDLNVVTSSPESQAGNTLSNLPNGQKTSQSGQAPAHVPRSVRLEKRKLADDAIRNHLSLALDELDISYAGNVDTQTTTTNGTYGQNYGGSSGTQNLQSFLGNKLAEETELSGSPEYVLRWKELDTPLEPPICLLRASGPRISDKDCSGSHRWPTPQVSQGPNMSENRGDGKRARKTAQSVIGIMTGWPTPKATNTTGASQTDSRQGSADLQTISGWTTPTAEDTTKMKTFAKNPDGTIRNRGDRINAQALTVVTEKRDVSQVLNPEFSRWLMGYPEAWAKAAPKMKDWLSVQRDLAESAKSKATETQSSHT
jgi:hypothetical protein